MAQFQPFNLITTTAPKGLSAVIPGTFTLLASQGQTTVSAPGCRPWSILAGITPLTPDAGNDMATSSYVMGTDSFIVNHANNARSDRTFSFVIFQGTPIIQGSSTIDAAQVVSGTFDSSLVPLFTSSASGAVPASGGGTTAFLRADRTWANPPGNAETDLSLTQAASAVTVNSSTGTGATIPAADTSNAGVMTAADRATLDGLGTAADLDAPESGNAASGEVVLGADTRLSDARTPTAHASTHAAAGSDPVSVAASQVSGLGTAATKSVPTTGNATSTQVVLGSDTRLSDSRTPTAHAASHASGGSDPISIASSQVSGLGTAAAQNTGTSGGNVPLLNGTNTWSGTQTAAGLLANGATAGAGYATGAGGAVTQATSKSTAVTLNKLVGKITMNSAALVGGASVSFVLNNSVIGSNDVVIAHLSGGFGSYGLTYFTASGSVTFFLTSFSGSSLSESVTINFAILKGAIA